MKITPFITFLVTTLVLSVLYVPLYGAVTDYVGIDTTLIGTFRYQAAGLSLLLYFTGLSVIVMRHRLTHNDQIIAAVLIGLCILIHDGVTHATGAIYNAELSMNYLRDNPVSHTTLVVGTVFQTIMALGVIAAVVAFIVTPNTKKLEGIVGVAAISGIILYLLFSLVIGRFFVSNFGLNRYVLGASHLPPRLVPAVFGAIIGFTLFRWRAIENERRNPVGAYR